MSASRGRLGRMAHASVVPLRTVGAGPPHNLPAQLSSLVGREDDLAEVTSALSSARLLTLTGTGGVGKTRLAVEAAARAIGAFPGGVWWVDLVPVTDPDGVESTLLRALEVRPLPGLTELDAAVAFLSARRALLVFDNCEQVIERVAAVAETLLGACPSISMMATSRAPLAIRGETRWAVPPLSLPTADHLSGSDAAQLFVDRAERVDRALRSDGDNAPAIAEICRRLDGIPLALELAAARGALLSPDAIARGLQDSLDLLSARSRGTDRRHRTLRASLDWSHGLLPEEPRALFRRLGVFAAGTTLELAQEVCADDDLPADRVLDVLEILVDHS